MLLALHVVVLVLLGVVLLTDPERRELDATTRAELGGSYVTLSDGVTHYRLTGPPDGPTVVLVHGGTIPMWTWDAQAEALVGAGFRVLAYDAFGRGYSDRPDVTYDRALYRRQLAEITDSLDLSEPFPLVGISMGGGTVVDFTAAHPERVARRARSA